MPEESWASLGKNEDDADDYNHRLKTPFFENNVEPSAPVKPDDFPGGPASKKETAEASFTRQPTNVKATTTNDAETKDKKQVTTTTTQDKVDKAMDEGAIDMANVANLVSSASNLALTAEAAASLSSVGMVKGLVENVHQVQVKLADLQADPSSPLYSAATFEELHIPEPILKGLYAMKFNRPSKVQEKALPLLLTNPAQNLIAQSQSGTGKTAAFVLTMLCRVDPHLAEPQALCVTPMRELARQIVDVVREMCQFTDIKVVAALKAARDDEGPATPNPNPPLPRAFTEQIVVGTPGTLLDLQHRGLLKCQRLKVLVFDEADVLFDKDGLGAQSLRLKKACRPDVQTLLFSATFRQDVMASALRLVPNANVLTLRKEELSVDAIRQFYMRIEVPDRRSSGPAHLALVAKKKIELLSAIYGLLTLGQSIIFVATREMADRVQAHMELEGYKTCLLHGGLGPQERDAVIDGFRRGEDRVLISTNVLSRGIDVLQVSLVINFDMPFNGLDKLPDCETYLHRIGRTGRFGRSGVSINFIATQEDEHCQSVIRDHFNRPINQISTGDLELLDKQLS